METIKFKTSIKCSGCVEKVTPFLNEAVGPEKWEVDTNSPSKVLTVRDTKDSDKIVQALAKAGYKAEPL